MDRSSKSVRLTRAGAVFAEHAARILGQLDTARAIAEQTAKGAMGEVTVAFVPSMLFRRLPILLKNFQDTHPGIQLNLQERNTSRQIEEIAKHRLDVGFIHNVPLPPEIESETLDTERLVCCLPRRHRLAGRSRIHLGELAGERILVFAREFAPHFHDKIAGLFNAHGIDVHTPFRIQHWFTVVALVQQSMGVALVPHSVSRSGFDNVVYIEVEDAQAEHPVSLIWHKDGASDAARIFIDYAKLNGLG